MGSASLCLINKQLFSFICVRSGETHYVWSEIQNLYSRTNLYILNCARGFNLSCLVDLILHEFQVSLQGQQNRPQETPERNPIDPRGPEAEKALRKSFRKPQPEVAQHDLCNGRGRYALYR